MAVFSGRALSEVVVVTSLLTFWKLFFMNEVVRRVDTDFDNADDSDEVETELKAADAAAVAAAAEAAELAAAAAAACDGSGVRERRRPKRPNRNVDGCGCGATTISELAGRLDNLLVSVAATLPTLAMTLRYSSRGISSELSSG